MKITASHFVALCMGYAIVCLAAIAQEFKPYPSSRLDEKLSGQASQVAQGKQSEVYTTSDSFESVYAFYKNLYNEYTMPLPPPPLSSGNRPKWAFFILDGAKSFTNSKFFIKVQRPYIGKLSANPDTDFEDVREVTVVQTFRQK